MDDLHESQQGHHEDRTSESTTSGGENRTRKKEENRGYKHRGGLRGFGHRGGRYPRPFQSFDNSNANQVGSYNGRCTNGHREGSLSGGQGAAVPRFDSRSASEDTNLRGSEIREKKFAGRGGHINNRSMRGHTNFKGSNRPRPFASRHLNEVLDNVSGPLSNQQQTPPNRPSRADQNSDRLNLLQHISSTLNPETVNANENTTVQASDVCIRENNNVEGKKVRGKYPRSYNTTKTYHNYQRSGSGHKTTTSHSVSRAAFDEQVSSVYKPSESSTSIQVHVREKQTKDSNVKISSIRTPKRRVKDEDDASQRDRLIDQLSHNAYECMVCCDRVKTQDSIWNCQNCFHVYHLRCVRKWARSSASTVDASGWRCPACQQVNQKVPHEYRCFCGKVRDPEWSRYETPHSCGEQCGKQRSQTNCPHRCNILCHPGPCPPCQVQVTRDCECGKSSKPVRCGLLEPILCGEKCEKVLNCGLHHCESSCHPGPCQDCSVKISQDCYCGKSTREVLCSKEVSGQLQFNCESLCGKSLSCSHHTCNRVCHAGPCDSCPLVPELITHCPCGQTTLGEILPEGSERRICTDPIPVCDKICDKVLVCGSQESPHRCSSVCHSGPCPPCPLVTSTRCRCGQQAMEVPCDQLSTIETLTCERKCNKKRQCGRHKCAQKCCVEEEHRCPMVCNRKLSCGLHTCEEPCHRGNCPPCWHTSFDELTCHCGATIMYPPIPCGTKPPECKELCTRPHRCQHPVTHNCHSEESCPPCTFLTEKFCYGSHELRSNVPCYLEDISCGMRCNKALPCGMHKCQMNCHPGHCLKNGEVCFQPCTKERLQCGHPCGSPCHPNIPCPEKNCKTKVDVTCQCGHLTGKITCAENLRAIQKMSASVVASRLGDMQSGQSVDISDILKASTSNKNKRLECSEECSLIERNRRLALALQIRNPELTNKLGPPAYTDFLKDQTKLNSTMISSVYHKISEVVQNAKQSKQKSRSYAFPPMNRDHRRVVHELAEYFGCETVSYDEEPKKNVVVTALRDKSWLPSVSIMTVVERDSVIRKGPPPIPHKTPLPGKSDGAESNASSAVTETQSEASKEPLIDYFDYDPDS